MTDTFTYEEEMVARGVCRTLGLDPDTLVGHGADPDEFGSVVSVWLSSPRWMRVAREVRVFIATHDALHAYRGPR